MPTDKGMRHSGRGVGGDERIAGVEGDGEREGFHFISFWHLMWMPPPVAPAYQQLRLLALPKSEK